MGKNAVRVSRYFQRNSNGAAENTIKFVIESIDRYRGSVERHDRRKSAPVSSHLKCAVDYKKTGADYLDSHRPTHLF
jgi:hypothetical protein